MYRLLIKYGDDYKNLVIAGDGGLILEANDPLNYEFGKSSKTYSINILNTYENNLLLDNLFNKSFDYTVRFNNCYLQIEDNIYLSGIILINKVDANRARSQFISAHFDLIQGLKTTRLNEYDYGMVHAINKTNILASESLDLHDGNVVYDLIDRGKTQYHVNSPEVNPDQYASYVHLAERWPAVRVKKIMDTILPNMTIKGNHFNLSLYNSSQYLLFNRPNEGITGNPNDFERNKNSVDFVRQNPFNRNLNFTGELFNTTFVNVFGSGDVVSDENNLVSDAIITIKEGAVYNLEAKIFFRYRKLNPNFTPVADVNNPFIVRLLIEDPDTSSSIKFHTFDLPYVLEADEDSFDIELYCSLGDIYLEEDQKIRFSIFVAGKHDNLVSGLNNVLFGIAPESYARLRIKTGIGENLQLDVKDIMPNMTGADFLKSYLKEYCLQLYLNAEKGEAVFYNSQGVNEPVVDLTQNVIADTLSFMPDNKRTNYLFRREVDDAKLQALIESAPETNPNNEIFIDNDSDTTQVIPFETATSLAQPCTRLGITSNALQIWQQYDRNNPSEPPELSFGGKLRLVFVNPFSTANYTLHLADNPALMTRTVHNRFTTHPPTWFDNFHKDNINNKVFGHILECDLIVNNDLIVGLYYSEEGRDWRNKFFINISGASGYYKLMRLERKDNNIWKAKFYKYL